MALIHSPKMPKLSYLELYYDTHNPKCYTPLDTTLYDITGNGNNGTFANSAFANDGMLDNMVYYDGTGTGDGLADGSRVDFPYIAVTSNPLVAPNGRTLIWIAKPEDTNRRGLLYGSTTINHIEQYNSSSFRTEAKLQNGYSFGSSGCSITPGKYDMFSLVFNNDNFAPTVKWYQGYNMFHEHSMINTNNDFDYFEPNSLGRETGTETYHYAPSYKGFIPIFMSFNAILTNEDIYKIYYCFKGRFGL